MTDYRLQVESAISALRIVLPDRHRWFGESTPKLPKHVADRLDPDTRQSYLAAQVQARLYQQFYLHGIAVPASHHESPVVIPGESDFVRALSEANNGAGSWQPGWAVVGREEGGVWARRDGLTIFVQASDYRSERSTTSAVDPSISLRMPKDFAAQLPGFYLAQSDEPMQPRPEDVLVRLYWHISAAGATTLMDSATSRLNAERVPFHLKVLNNPDAYGRNDAAVLYITRDDLARAAPYIKRVYLDVRDHLLPDVPTLTRPIASGLALAEDPRNGESFGLHRCRLLAEAFVDAARQGAHAPSELLDAVGARFRQEGVNLAEPYLNSGSNDDYAQILNIDVAMRSDATRHLDQPTCGDAEASPSPDDYRDVARLIGDRIVQDAIWHADRCTWLGPRMSLSTGQAANRHATYGVIGPDVYSGTAGIALFLAQLYAETGIERYRRTAHGAMLESARLAGQLAEGGRIGFYTGWPGVAVACARVGCLLDDHALAQATPREIVAQCTRTDPPYELDLLSGVAGAAVAFLELWRRFEDERYLTEAIRFGDVLVSTAKRRGACAWWPVRSLSGKQPLTGFAHGAAGIAFALLELFAASREERFRHAATAAFAFERRNFHPELQNWLDLRYPLVGSRFGPGALAASVWCHGSGGIAISRLRAWNILGDETYLDEAEIALNATRAWLESGNASSNNLWSLCHGLPGNADILLWATELLPRRASSLRRSATETADSGRTVVSSANESSDLFDTDEPGLLLGHAGIGYYFLRASNQKIPSVLVPTTSAFATHPAS